MSGVRIARKRVARLAGRRFDVSYAVKEIFYTLQGEGMRAGRAAVFVRFAGCNLWSGREQDRATAVCQFCDTDFVGVDGDGGGRFESAADLAARVVALWPREGAALGAPYVVCTGGEPLLQVDAALVEALHAAGFEIAVETNGTIEAPDGLDWICVSPKAGSEVVQRRGDELKLVFPQDGVRPEAFEAWDFDHFVLQPKRDLKDEENSRAHVRATVAYCLARPHWQLGLQTHIILGLR